MRAADADILIHAGLGGGGPDHWHSRWRRRLSTARRIEQRDWNKPVLDEWVETAQREVAACSRPVVLIGHSMGVITLLHAARKIAERVAGAFLVAPPSESVMLELPGVDKAFAPAPRQPLPFPALMVGSSDDPYADAEFTRLLAHDLGAEFVDAGSAGHINVESGHGPWPEGSIRFAVFVSKL
jgi:predicted alpha/beta hydrolase family esterase